MFHVCRLKWLFYYIFYKFYKVLHQASTYAELVLVTIDSYKYTYKKIYFALKHTVCCQCLFIPFYSSAKAGLKGENLKVGRKPYLWVWFYVVCGYQKTQVYLNLIVLLFKLCVPYLKIGIALKIKLQKLCLIASEWNSFIGLGYAERKFPFCG